MDETEDEEMFVQLHIYNTHDDSDRNKFQTTLNNNIFETQGFYLFVS